MIRYKNREITIDNPTVIRELLKREKINPIAVVVVKNGKPVTEEERILPDDEVEIISVISGG